jgi:hypothetical protein
MKVHDIVHFKTDKPGREVLGRVIAVNGRAHRVTVKWETAKMTEEPSENLMLWDPQHEN